MALFIPNMIDIVHLYGSREGHVHSVASPNSLRSLIHFLLRLLWLLFVDDSCVITPRACARGKAVVASSVLERVVTS